MSFRETLNLSEGAVLLLGNEAIARGALEAGVDVATAYPGTPSSEILEALISVRDRVGFYADWCVNEKVAYEVAYAAAASGLRAIVAMKHVGLNVAAEPLMSSAYTGVNGALVVVTADDPSMWSSQNEQDNRIYGFHSYIPVFEPYDPAEAKDMVKYLFGFSGEFKHPVILRTTTRVSHARGPVTLAPIPKLGRERNIGRFNKEERYVLVPSIARRDKKELLRRWESIVKRVNNVPFNRIEGSGKLLVIASGVSYGYVKEAAERLGESVTILKVGTPYPIPRELVLRSLDESGANKVLVVEELEPLVELQVRSLVNEVGINVRVVGKELVGLPYEMTFTRAYRALAKALGKDVAEVGWSAQRKPQAPKLPPRPPAFCPGCPYRPFFYAFRKFLNRSGIDYIVTGDIGCYALGRNPPYKLQDIVIEMGGSIGTANGFSIGTPQVVFAVIGDSTFYHAGLPPLVNAVWHKLPIITVILDNEVTAMTGHQPSPASRLNGQYIPPENVVRGFGVNFVRVVDPFNVGEVENALKEAVAHVRTAGKPAVLIVRRKCALEALRALRRAGVAVPKFSVNKEKCVACGICYRVFACPAIRKGSDGKAVIDAALCSGCGVCADICPAKAIEPIAEAGSVRSLIDKYWR